VNKKSPLSAFLTVILISGLVLTSAMHFGTVQAATEVTGIISSDTTWTKANSPYTLTGPIVVNSNAVLTIEAGVTIDLNGNYLEVSGTLIAKGNSADWRYFNDGSINFTSTSTASCIIENAILKWMLVSISSSVKISNTYVLGQQAKNVINIYGGSPTITNNTLTGNVDSISIVSISGGAPTISNNNIIAHVDNGLYPDPPIDMNRFGTEYGVYAENVNGAYITDNRFILPFRVASIQVVSGSATVEGNSELLYNPVTTPAPTPSPTPPISPTPTLPPYSATSPTPIPVPGQSYFFVESNSTISGLFFNSTSSELSFTVNGTSGTTGYVKVTIAKSLVSSVQNVKAYLDGNQLDVAITSNEDSWLLSFTYMHSTHHVRINLATNAATTPFLGIENWIWIGVIIIFVVVGAGLLVYFKKRKR
jgi:hypothetical protein